MTIFLQLLLNSLIAGAIYSLVAVGFSLIFSTARFVHFAHGATVAIGAYALYQIHTVWGLGFLLSALLAIIVAAATGYIMYLLVYQPLRKKGSSNAILLIASFAILTIVESLILIIFGPDIKTIGYLETGKGVEIMGAIITPLQVLIIIISLILFAALYAFIKYSRLGKAIRAVADNRFVAEILGISSSRVYTFAFLTGSAIAGLAGILIGLEQNLTPTMGMTLIIKGFTGAIVGGIGNIYGAVIGSLFLGIAENFGVWFLPSGYKEAISFVLLIVFLLWRPRGILGSKKTFDL